MAKVFRLHTGAANTLGNWDDSVKIGSKAIDSIPDPAGAANSHEITSIPSPFARMDLVKNAFKYVADNNLDGRTIYHKLVSDALDVGQIFFNIEKYRDIIEIIVWDKNTALKELNESSYDEHHRLGRTYGTYIKQDQDVYHFDKMDCIYLINYKAPSAPHEMNIIGATSPATLFFTSANDLSFVGSGNHAITFGNDRPFDGAYIPLYKRDEAYIKFWWSIKGSWADFAALFPEVNSYLDKCYSFISDNLRGQLQAITNKTYSQDYEDISVDTVAQNYVTILGQRLKGKKMVNDFKSDFEMSISQAMKKQIKKVPLALPVETFTSSYQYVISTWDKNTHVPYEDKKVISSRVLPNDGTKYPYLTISDFLEDSIIKIPHEFNSTAFFNGNDDKPEGQDSYLLPLKKEFFNYFQVSDLMSKVDNKDMIEMKRLAGNTGVKIILRIPVKGGHIKYERIYYNGGKPDAMNNKGAIIDRDFTLALFPNIKYQEDIKPYYRASVIDRDSFQTGKDNQYKLTFYGSQNENVDYDAIVQRNRNTDGGRYDEDKADSATYALTKEFRYIQISDNEDIKAIIIPRMVERAGYHKFRFAIDFGTTNTHIEYSVDGGSSKAFDIHESDKQLQRLHIDENEYALNEIIKSDFIAETIGVGSAYSYPMRTVLSETNNTNWNRPVYSMAHTNIPFTYEKSMQLPYNILHTNLKWSTNNDDKQRAAMYIECILVMLRNKVLLNNGDLSKTEIVWFYPASMTQSRYNKFNDEWKSSFKKFFNAPDKNIISISESIAPYYFYKNKKGATSTAVSIDIGGETTDVLLVRGGEPENLTSFRFAANAIFGDGYSYDADSNGFVKEYSDKIKHLLGENNLANLQKVLESLEDEKKSSDIIAFFFSLAGNRETRDIIDFGKMLADDNKGKYAFILFYVAIIYHIATIMKAKSYPMPRHITFSGNGSKLLSILSTNNFTLERFTKIIFEKVFDETYPIDGLTIIRPENTKESTCKGGIIIEPFHSQDYSEIRQMKTILLGSNSTAFLDQGVTYDTLGKDTIDDIIRAVSCFIEFVFNLDKDFSFYQEFDTDKSILESVKKLCYRDIKTYLEIGLSKKKEMLVKDGADNAIEETLFFYPLIGVINAVVREVYSL